jgi:hypothetical protein
MSNTNKKPSDAAMRAVMDKARITELRAPHRRNCICCQDPERYDHTCDCCQQPLASPAEFDAIVTERDALRTQLERANDLAVEALALLNDYADSENAKLRQDIAEHLKQSGAGGV